VAYQQLLVRHRETGPSCPGGGLSPARPGPGRSGRPQDARGSMANSGHPSAPAWGDGVYSSKAKPIGSPPLMQERRPRSPGALHAHAERACQLLPSSSDGTSAAEGAESCPDLLETHCPPLDRRGPRGFDLHWSVRWPGQPAAPVWSGSLTRRNSAPRRPRPVCFASSCFTKLKSASLSCRGCSEFSRRIASRIARSSCASSPPGSLPLVEPGNSLGSGPCGSQLPGRQPPCPASSARRRPDFGPPAIRRTWRRGVRNCPFAPGRTAGVGHCCSRENTRASTPARTPPTCSWSGA